MSSGDPGFLSNQKELPPDKASQGLPNAAMDRLASIRGIAETISISRQHGSVNWKNRNIKNLTNDSPSRNLFLGRY